MDEYFVEEIMVGMIDEWPNWIVEAELDCPGWDTIRLRDSMRNFPDKPDIMENMTLGQIKAYLETQVENAEQTSTFTLSSITFGRADEWPNWPLKAFLQHPDHTISEFRHYGRDPDVSPSVADETVFGLANEIERQHRRELRWRLQGKS